MPKVFLRPHFSCPSSSHSHSLSFPTPFILVSSLSPKLFLLFSFLVSLLLSPYLSYLLSFHFLFFLYIFLHGPLTSFPFSSSSVTYSSRRYEQVLYSRDVPYAWFRFSKLCLFISPSLSPLFIFTHFPILFLFPFVNLSEPSLPLPLVYELSVSFPSPSCRFAFDRNIVSKGNELFTYAWYMDRDARRANIRKFSYEIHKNMHLRILILYFMK